MASERHSRPYGKIALAALGLGLAALSIGATAPEYPTLARADQGLSTSDCASIVVDDVSVCVAAAMVPSAGVHVVTVAPGVSIVE